jgi:prophage DNA circulation protein
MADESQIITGSYKGIPIAMESGTVDGGRKVAIKQFPSRDTQSIEDLGLQPRRYSVEIIISDKAQEDYFAYRNRLIAALESKGPGELIHPMYGRIEDVVATSFSLNESFGSFGDTTIRVQFEVDKNTGIPQSAGNVITQVAAANAVVQEAAAKDIEEEFSITEKFAGNFAAGVDKVNGFIDRAKDATSFIGEIAQTADQVAAQLGDLAANVNSLASDPLQLAQSITSTFESISGLYASTSATFDTFIGFFGFGDDDTPINQTTAGRIERQKNNDIFNGAIASASLGYAYLNATAIDFETTQEVDDVAAQLDAQYLAVQENGSSQEVKDAVSDMRVQVLAALDQARLNASQIITVQTTSTTTRLLSHSYYGDDSQAELIAGINGIDDVSFVEGSVQVPTL